MTDLAEAFMAATRFGLGACEECAAKFGLGALPQMHDTCRARLIGATAMVAEAQARTCED